MSYRLQLIFLIAAQPCSPGGRVIAGFIDRGARELACYDDAKRILSLLMPDGTPHYASRKRMKWAARRI